MLSPAAIAHPPSRRVRARREKRRWGWRLVSLLVISIVLALGYGFYGYLTDKNIFQIRHVEIHGGAVLSDESLRDATGINDTDTLWTVDPEQVRQRVLALPYVDTCSVSRSMKNIVVVEITERVEIASIMVNNRIYEIDREGRVLQEVSPLKSPKAPLITNLPGIQSVTPGQFLENETLQRALSLWETFQVSPVASQLTLSEISAEGNNELYMFFDEIPFETRWGRADFEAQVRRFEILWREKQGQLPCKAYLDLRFDEDVVCQ